MDVVSPGDTADTGLNPNVPFHGSFGNLIIFHNFTKAGPGEILHATCSKAKIPMTDVEKKLGQIYTCDVYIDGNLVATGKCTSKQKAKEEAKDIALSELKKMYYTIKTKKAFVAEPDRPKDPEDTDAADKSRFQPLGEGNIGFKMLKSLGWVPGTGLSKEGIVNPLDFQISRSRAGLGSKAYTVGNSRELKSLKDMVSDYAQKNTFYDLVFDPSTTEEQRKQIHQYAHNFGLRTKSVWLRDEGTGRPKKEKQRQLTVFKDIDLFRVGRLLLSGTLQPDHVLHQKYEIFPPTHPPV